MLTNLDGEIGSGTPDETVSDKGAVRSGASTQSLCSEAAILKRMGGGDRAALQELYHLYSKPLFSYAFKVLSSEQDAEEAVQDSFVRYWRKAGNYDPSRAKPYSWAVLILRGICYDRLRQRNKLSNVPLVADSEKSLQKVSDRSIESIAFRDMAMQVQNAMSLLEPEEQSCVELAVFGEYTHSGIAKKLDRPLGTVKSQMRRGMTKLRQLLKSEDQEDHG